MTGIDTEEIIHCHRMLKETHAATGLMYEAFHKDNPADFNRSWFTWANTLFGELIINIHKEHKEIFEKELV